MNTDPVGGLCALKGFSFCRIPVAAADLPAEPGVPFLDGIDPVGFPGLALAAFLRGRSCSRAGCPRLISTGREPDAPGCVPNRLVFTRVVPVLPKWTLPEDTEPELLIPV